VLAALSGFALSLCGAAAAAATTVIYQGTATVIEKTLPDASDLWVSPEDMTRISGFVLKPEGLCREELCLPLRQDEDSASFARRDGQKWLNLTELARKAKQEYVRDAHADVWSFGEFPLTRAGFLRSALAPDFALEDRQGKTVRLSDFRGKKVLLVTWASWCGCRLDVAAWQPIYEELKGQGFELISVAQDTGGEAAAGPIFDAAQVSYTALIDRNHRISALYNFVNVPSAAWIDEQGRVVRINEGTYAKRHQTGPGRSIGTDEYAVALRDWVKSGSQSRHVWSADQVAQKIRSKSAQEARAEALFALGSYFYTRKDSAQANRYWNEAQALYPDSWNMHRQDWAITEPANAGRNWISKRRSSEKPYYGDLELN
jgi:peroxiredoxin